MRRSTPIALLLLCGVLLAQDGPATKPGAPVDAWITALASPDPAQRSAARQELMGLSFDELGVLKQIVAARSLAPAQVDGLRDAVLYVHVRHTLEKDRRTRSGFLGVSLPMSAIEQLDERDAAVPVGMPVVDRLLGFVAYRYLEDGDIILAAGTPDSMNETRTRDLLVRSVQLLNAGDPVCLRVQRGSRLLTISFPLDSAIPMTDFGDDGTGVQGMIDAARIKAERYIDEQFPSLKLQLEA